MGGKTAEQIMKWREQGENVLVQDAFFESQFRFFNFTVKVTSRIFQDEQKLNFACIKATPLSSFAFTNKSLVKRLELYQSIPDLTN